MKRQRLSLRLPTAAIAAAVVTLVAGCGSAAISGDSSRDMLPSDADDACAFGPVENPTGSQWRESIMPHYLAIHRSMQQRLAEGSGKDSTEASEIADATTSLKERELSEPDLVAIIDTMPPGAVAEHRELLCRAYARQLPQLEATIQGKGAAQSQELDLIKTASDMRAGAALIAEHPYWAFWAYGVSTCSNARFLKELSSLVPAPSDPKMERTTDDASQMAEDSEQTRQQSIGLLCPQFQP